MWACCAGQIVDDVETGKQLLSQLGEGVRWYCDMLENIQKLEQLLQGFVTARALEREMFLENLKKQSEVRCGCHQSCDVATALCRPNLL